MVCGLRSGMHFSRTEGMERGIQHKLRTFVLQPFLRVFNLLTSADKSSRNNNKDQVLTWRRKNMNHNPTATHTRSSVNVNHQSWVHCNQLKLGMYVVELDKPWEDSPFMFQGFFLDSPQLIEQVQQESQYVLVHQQKSTKINRSSPVRFCSAVSSSSAADWAGCRG